MPAKWIVYVLALCVSSLPYLLHLSSLYSTRNINLFAINYDPSTDRAKKVISFQNGNIQCTNCYGKLDLTLEFEMNITFAKLTHLAVNAVGSADFHLEAQFQYRGSYSKSDSFIWATLRSQPIPFSLGGIPLVLQLAAPIEAGYSLDVRTSSLLKARAAASGKIAYGVRYDPASRSLVPQSSHSYSMSGHLDQLSTTENGDVERESRVFLLF